MSDELMTLQDELDTMAAMGRAQREALGLSPETAKPPKRSLRHPLRRRQPMDAEMREARLSRAGTAEYR